MSTGDQIQRRDQSGYADFTLIDASSFTSFSDTFYEENKFRLMVQVRFWVNA